MLTSVRACPIDRRPWPQRAAAAIARSLAGYLSRQAAHPRGRFGRTLGQLWVTETATVNDAAIGSLAPVAGESVLEIGFGPGRTLGLLTDRGAQVTGAEVSSEMVRLAARRNRSSIDTGRLSLHVGGGTTLSLPDNTFDAVLSVHSLYFWPDPQTTIREIARVLRPGGRVMLVFRGGEHPLPRRLDPRVYAAVTTEQAVAWLEQAGLVDVQSQRPSNVPKTMTFVKGTFPAARHAPDDSAPSDPSRPRQPFAKQLP